MGELMWVGIYEALVRHEVKKSGIGGSMFTVIIFALFHIKHLWQKFGIEENFVPKNWPLIEDWSDVICKTIKNTSNNPMLDSIGETMENCTVECINWHPYLDQENIPKNYRRYLEMSLAIFPIFKKEVCLFYTPYIAPQQFDISDELVAQMRNWFTSNVCGPKKYISLKGTQGTRQKKYTTLWAKVLKRPINEIRKKVLEESPVQETTIGKNDKNDGSIGSNQDTSRNQRDDESHFDHEKSLEMKYMDDSTWDTFEFITDKEIVIDVLGFQLCKEHLNGLLNSQELGNFKKWLPVLHPKAKDDFDIQALSKPDLPRQKNGVDCGVYLLQFIEQWGTVDNIVIEKKKGRKRATSAERLADDTRAFLGSKVLGKRESKQPKMWSPR
ncbi:Cysteine proteinases superfamily protein [Perilla frutescens var. hirtella]|nr:Cysteine proteinases superfamily protein [Perilla frutescens var. hirtella]